MLEPKKRKLKWRVEGHEGCDKMTKEEKTEAKSRNSEKHRGFYAAGAS